MPSLSRSCGSIASLPSGSVISKDLITKIVCAVVPSMLEIARATTPSERQEVVRKRMCWTYHADALLYESEFRSYYRMDISSFERLLQIVGPHISFDALQSARRTPGQKPLCPASMLQCCLSWLAGGHYQHIRLLTGVSASTFYRILRRVIAAINKAPELKPKFPVTASEKKAASAGFASLSTKGIIQGCIGAIDGWLCPIRVPSRTECGRVVSFFSGHYQKYGLNVQACVDHASRFTAFAIRCPGGMNDAMAFKKWSLSTFLDSMEGPYFVVGDNAYTQTRVVMTPYNKAQVGKSVQRDSYNFFLSQLRIRVEMGFGLLANKWRILKSPLGVKLSSCPAVISACMRLHNFCIDERIRHHKPLTSKALLHEVRTLNKDTDVSYDETLDEEVPDASDDEDEHQRVALVDTFEVGDEPIRASLVQHIANHNLVRPIQNRARKQKENKSKE